MGQITVSGVSPEVREGLEALAERYDMSISALARNAFSEFLHDRDDVPEHVRKNASFDKLTRENRWKMRVMWFESNVREFFEDCLAREVSPPPERVEWAFVQSAHQEIVEQAPDRYRDELADYLEKEKDRYRAIYMAENPGESTHNPKRKESVIEWCAERWDAGKEDMVVTYAQKLHTEGNGPTGMGAEAIISEAKGRATDSWDGETLSTDTAARPSIED